MSRVILFRGRRIDNGEWIYGYYIVAAGIPFVSTFGVKESVPVIPETVGQYTGLKDKNDKEIFEGDIVKVTSTNWWQSHKIEKVVYEKAIVSFSEKSNEIQFKPINGKWNIKYHELFRDGVDRHYLEVIGNIHEEV